MNDRDLILGAVDRALDDLGPNRTPLPEYDTTLPVMRGTLSAPDRWLLFCRRIAKVNGIALENASALGEFLRLRAAGNPGYCDPALLDWLRPHLGSTKVVSSFDRSQVDALAFAVTRARGAIAETGSVILDDQTTTHRLAALAPWIHIAVFPADSIFLTLGQAVEAFGTDPNIIWVTGPSKTADVEGVLVEGVHGPGVQAACLRA